MAFVPGYDHDIFISYAHVNDLPPRLNKQVGGGQTPGWVATLVWQLKSELAQRIGRFESFDIWMDQENLRGNHRLTEEIAARIGRSATLVAIYSPAYLASVWCVDEIRSFSRYTAGPGDNRVFVIEKDPVEVESGKPMPELLGRRNYEFWYRQRNHSGSVQPLAYPMSPEDEIEYIRRVRMLATDVHAQLKQMGGKLHHTAHFGFGPLTSRALAQPTRRATVLLAEVTDDLDPTRDEFAEFLAQEGFEILPKRPYPFAHHEFESAFDNDLSRSELFVQLLGPVAGKRREEAPDGYGWVQYERARRSGIGVMQWRNPGLKLDEIRLARHRELLELDTVESIPLDDFRRQVLGVVAMPVPPIGPRTDSVGILPRIFLNAEPRHHGFADKVREQIGDHAIWIEPSFEGQAGQVREAFESTFANCDAMVTVYADNESWALSQLLQAHKLGAQGPSRKIPVLDAPPKEKPKLGIYNLPNMAIIDARDGVGSEAIAQLRAYLEL